MTDTAVTAGKGRRGTKTNGTAAPAPGPEQTSIPVGDENPTPESAAGAADTQEPLEGEVIPAGQMEKAKEIPLAKGPVSLTENALTITGKLSYKAYQAQVLLWCAVNNGAGWWLGDLQLYGDAHYGEEKALQALPTDRYGEQTLANVKWVAKQFPAERRRAALSFAVHEVVAGCTPQEQDEWLDAAEKYKWGRNDLRKARAGAKLTDGSVASGVAYMTKQTLSTPGTPDSTGPAGTSADAGGSSAPTPGDSNAPAATGKQTGPEALDDADDGTLTLSQVTTGRLKMLLKHYNSRPNVQVMTLTVLVAKIVEDAFFAAGLGEDTGKKVPAGREGKGQATPAANGPKSRSTKTQSATTGTKTASANSIDKFYEGDSENADIDPAADVDPDEVPPGMPPFGPKGQRDENGELAGV